MPTEKVLARSGRRVWQPLSYFWQCPSVNISSPCATAYSCISFYMIHRAKMGSDTLSKQIERAKSAKLLIGTLYRFVSVISWSHYECRLSTGQGFLHECRAISRDKQSTDSANFFIQFGWGDIVFMLRSLVELPFWVWGAG